MYKAQEIQTKSTQNPLPTNLEAYIGLNKVWDKGTVRSIVMRSIIGGVLLLSMLYGQNTDKANNNHRILEIEDPVTLEAPEEWHTTSKVEVHPPFEDGEQLNFQIKYLGLTGGTATISARRLDANRIEFKLTAKTAPWIEKLYRLRVTMISETLLDTYQTLRYTEDKQEKGFYFSNTQIFHPEQKEYTYQYIKNEDFRKKTVDYSSLEGGVSVLGAFFFTRTTKLQQNINVYTNCFFQDTFFQIGVEPVKIRKISTAFGRREVFVVRPLLQAGKIISDQEDMLIYLSNDVARIPLRVDIFTTFGPLRINLISYQSTVTAD